MQNKNTHTFCISTKSYAAFITGYFDSHWLSPGKNTWKRSTSTDWKPTASHYWRVFCEITVPSNRFQPRLNDKFGRNKPIWKHKCFLTCCVSPTIYVANILTRFQRQKHGCLEKLNVCKLTELEKESADLKVHVCRQCFNSALNAERTKKDRITEKVNKLRAEWRGVIWFTQNKGVIMWSIKWQVYVSDRGDIFFWKRVYHKTYQLAIISYCVTLQLLHFNAINIIWFTQNKRSVRCQGRMWRLQKPEDKTQTFGGQTRGSNIWKTCPKN